MRLVVAGKRLVCASGGFDFFHVGHLNYLEHAARLGDRLVVIVNGNSFLERKKGYYVMDGEDRRRIIAALHCVHTAILYESPDDHVGGILRQLRPSVFTNGGDRSDPSTWHPEEVNACETLGIQMIGGIGGTTKTISSSSLFERLTKFAEI